MITDGLLKHEQYNNIQEYLKSQNNQTILTLTFFESIFTGDSKVLFGLDWIGLVYRLPWKCFFFALESK